MDFLDGQELPLNSLVPPPFLSGDVSGAAAPGVSMELRDDCPNTGCDEGVDAISRLIEGDAVRKSVRGIDVLASVAADLDLESTPRSEVADGGSSILFSGEIRTRDRAVPAHIDSKECGWKTAPGSEVADVGSSKLFSGEIRTADGAVPAHIESKECGWKRRKYNFRIQIRDEYFFASFVFSGTKRVRLTARATQSKMTSIERCLLESEGKHGPDTFAPVVGTSFDSCQEAYEQYNLFSWENGFGIRHGKSRWGEGRYQLMHEIVCQCQGKADKENSVSCKTQCKARMRLLRTEDHGWYVSIFSNEHNHHLSANREETREWNSHSEINPVLMNFIKNLRENNVSLSKVYNILNSTHGDQVGPPFCKQNLKYLCSRIAQDSITDDMQKTVNLLYEMKCVDPNLSVCVDTDIEGSPKFILWSTGKNKQDYVYFGDVVTFDTTYRTNLYNMPFGIFVGVNNHYQPTIFGGVLMREETTVGFEWAFTKFVEVMNGKHPVTMLTDQCRAMEAAIKNVLPNTRHRWCKWHVIKCAKEHLGGVYSKKSLFKEEFHKLINESKRCDQPTGNHLTRKFWEESGPIQSVVSHIHTMCIREFKGDPSEVGFLEFFFRRVHRDGQPTLHAVLDGRGGRQGSMASESSFQFVLVNNGPAGGYPWNFKTGADFSFPDPFADATGSSLLSLCGVAGCCAFCCKPWSGCGISVATCGPTLVCQICGSVPGAIN